MVRRIVAFDPSLTCIGVADSARRLPEEIRPPPGMNGDERVDFLVRSAVGVVLGGCEREFREKEHLVVIEGYAYGTKHPPLHVAEMIGCLKLALYLRGIPYVVLPPNKRMKIATGKGSRVKKEAIYMAAVKRLGYQGTSYDEADALWLLQIALQRYGLPGAVSLPAKHMEVIGGIEWPTA